MNKAIYELECIDRRLEVTNYRTWRFDFRRHIIRDHLQNAMQAARDMQTRLEELDWLIAAEHVPSRDH